jgi:hypothetical protein
MTDAKVRIVGEDATGAAWAQALSTAQSAANSMRSLFTGAFAGLGIAAVAESIDSALKLGEALKSAGIKAGVSASTMSELAYVGKLAGVSMDELSTGLKKMETAVSMAASGSKQQQVALDALGLTTKNLIGLAPDKMFELIGTRIAELKDPTDRARAAVEFFGRAGTGLIPIFEQGGDAIERLRTEARDLGQTLSDDAVKKLADAEVEVKKLDNAFSSLWTTLVSKMAPALGQFAEGITASLAGDHLKQLTLQLDELTRRKAEIDAQGEKGGIMGALFGPGGYNSGAIDKQIEAVRAQIELQKMALKPSQLQDVGTPSAGGGPTAPGGDAKGFAAAEAAMHQAEEDAAQFKADMKDIEKANNDFIASLAKQGTEQTKVEKTALDEWLTAYEKRKTGEEETDDKIATMRKTSLDSAIQAVESFRQTSTQALDGFLLHGQFTFRKLGAYLLESLAVAQLNKALNGIFDAIETKLESLASSSGGAGGLGGLLGSLFGLGGGASAGTAVADYSSAGAGSYIGDMAGFASGGSFDVGGSGGTDSQLVGFRATPGEHVTVGEGASGAGGDFNFQPTYIINAPNGDQQLRNALPGLLAETANRTKADMLEAFRRNNLPHPPRA